MFKVHRCPTIFMGLIFTLVILPMEASLQEPFLPDNPQRGARIFNQKGCINCHAINGEGGTDAADLGEQQFQGGFLELARLMWNHFPNMKSTMDIKGGQLPSFTQREMEDLFAYLFFVPYLGKPGDDKRGKELLSEKGCLQCHGEVGYENARASNLSRLNFFVSPVYLAQTMWNHGPEMQAQMDKLGIERPLLHGDEMTDLAAYLQFISAGGLKEKVYMQPGNPKTGANVFQVKGCNYCHSNGGKSKGNTTAPDLSQAEISTTLTQIAGTMWNHSGEMSKQMAKFNQPWPRFTGEEMADVISYIYYLRFNDPPGDSKNGEQVFQSKNCSMCHDLPLESNQFGLHQIPSIQSPMTIVMLMWNHASKMDSVMSEVGIQWPDFDQKEMTDLYAFLKEATEDQHEN